MEIPDKLYTDDGRVIYTCDLRYINHGANADVWRLNDDYAVKLFRPNTQKMAPEVVDIFKKIHFSCFPNLYSTLKRSYHQEEFDGYLMDYLEEGDGISILDIPSKNLISSVFGLEEDFSSMTSCGVISRDIRVGNTMITKDCMLKLYDYDLFYIQSDYDIPIDSVSTEYQLLKELFIDAICMDYSFSASERVEVFKYINEVFSFYQFQDVMPSQVIKDSFSRDDTPKKFFKRYVSGKNC